MIRAQADEMLYNVIFLMERLAGHCAGGDVGQMELRRIGESLLGEYKDLDEKTVKRELKRLSDDIG